MKEDETILNCSNLFDPNLWDVYSTQRWIVTKLKKNPSFKKTEDVVFKGKILGVRGTLPYNSIIFRKQPSLKVKSELKTDSDGGVPND